MPEVRGAQGRPVPRQQRANNLRSRWPTFYQVEPMSIIPQTHKQVVTDAELKERLREAAAKHRKVAASHTEIAENLEARIRGMI